MKKIDDTFSKRSFRAYHSKINPSFLCCLGEGLKLGRFNIQVISDEPGARIPWRDINFPNVGALAELPNQGMLPGPSTDDHYLEQLFILRW